jgi:hypothetical protein
MTIPIMLKFDTFIFKEMDGRLRMLFEEGSSYIYVWFTADFKILAFQYLISGVTGLQYYETGTIRINEVSRKPFNRSLAGPAGLSDQTALEQLAKFESAEFPSLIASLVALGRKIAEEAFIAEKERPLILKYLPG